MRWGRLKVSALGSEGDTLFELVENEGFEAFEREAVFEGSPKSLDEGDGADFPDGAEALADAGVSECIAKAYSGELASLIGDEVTREPEPPHGFSEKLNDRFCGGLLWEHTSADRKSRKRVEDDGELEAEKAEETGNIGEVDEEDMIRKASSDGSRSLRIAALRGISARRLFAKNPSDGAFGELPSGACEGLCDFIVTCKVAMGVEHVHDGARTSFRRRSVSI